MAVAYVWVCVGVCVPLLCFGEEMISLPSSPSSLLLTACISFVFPSLSLLSPNQPSRQKPSLSRPGTSFFRRSLTHTPGHILQLTQTHTDSHIHTHTLHILHIHTLHNHGTKEDPNQNHHRRAQPTGNSITLYSLTRTLTHTARISPWPLPVCPPSNISLSSTFTQNKSSADLSKKGHYLLTLPMDPTNIHGQSRLLLLCPFCFLFQANNIHPFGFNLSGAVKNRD